MKTGKKKKDKLTTKDVKRASAMFGAVCLLLAVIVSIPASILWIIGLACMLFAFQDRLKLPKKKKCGVCGK